MERKCMSLHVFSDILTVWFVGVHEGWVKGVYCIGYIMKFQILMKISNITYP